MNIDNTELRKETIDLGYYYSPRGFVGRVVEKEGIFYVVLRGTDSSETFKEGFWKAITAGFNNEAIDPTFKSDIGDFITNLRLDMGTGLYSQADDAIELAQAAIDQLAGGDRSKVVVCGQSLGGGLTLPTR